MINSHTFSELRDHNRIQFYISVSSSNWFWNELFQKHYMERQSWVDGYDPYDETNFIASYMELYAPFSPNLISARVTKENSYGQTAHQAWVILVKMQDTDLRMLQLIMSQRSSGWDWERSKIIAVEKELSAKEFFSLFMPTKFQHLIQ